MRCGLSAGRAATAVAVKATTGGLVRAALIAVLATACLGVLGCRACRRCTPGGLGSLDAGLALLVRSKAL